MLRRNIGRPKSSNKTRSAHGWIFPKSVWAFYFKYAIPGSITPLVLWGLFLLVAMSNNVLFPFFERWFVALFENPVPAGVNFVQYALPTIVLITVLNLCISISSILRGMYHARWAPQIRNRISVELTDYIHSQSMSFWTGRMAGKVSSQINYVAEGFWVVEDFLRIAGLFFFMLLSVGLIFSINVYVAIIFAVVFVMRAIYSWVMIKPMNNASKESSDAFSTLSGKNIDSIVNFSVVKMFAGKVKEREYLNDARQKHILARIHAFFVQRLFWGVPAVLWDICYGATLVFCVYLYMRGTMSLSEIVFTISVYFSVMNSISTIVNQIPVITERIGSATKAYSELVVPVDVTDVPNASTLSVRHGKIEIKNLSFKYKRKWVLHDLNLTIKPGERVGLVGASGAGKSTLVHLLMRFYDPVQGAIYIDGQNIRDVTQDSLRENIAFIPQEPTMFNRTLRENIAYGKTGATLRQVRHAATQAAADEFIMATEKKYDSFVGDRGIKLSGGQRQRVAIARAFLKDAPILVLDEATSALDSETEIAIQKSFDELASGRTTVVIAHRLSTLRNMDRIIVLKQGRIVEHGSHQQLLRRKGEYARLWRMQSGGFIQE